MKRISGQSNFLYRLVFGRHDNEYFKHSHRNQEVKLPSHISPILDEVRWYWPDEVSREEEERRRALARLNVTLCEFPGIIDALKTWHDAREVYCADEGCCLADLLSKSGSDGNGGCLV